jgi:hypothetical protein
MRPVVFSEVQPVAVVAWILGWSNDPFDIPKVRRLSVLDLFRAVTLSGDGIEIVQSYGIR